MKVNGAELERFACLGYLMARGHEISVHEALNGVMVTIEGFEFKSDSFDGAMDQVIYRTTFGEGALNYLGIKGRDKNERAYS